MIFVFTWQKKETSGLNCLSPYRKVPFGLEEVIIVMYEGGLSKEMPRNFRGIYAVFIALQQV